MTEEEMVGWHHQVNEHEFEQTLGDTEEQLQKTVMEVTKKLNIEP